MNKVEDEEFALNYIRSNPHIALKNAVIGHLENFHGCDCPLDKLGKDPKFCKQYRIEMKEEQKEEQR